MASNYPPGVSGNEPQITGIWPIEEMADSSHQQLVKAQDIIEDVVGQLDDQGYLPDSLDRKFATVLEGIQKLQDGVQDLIPDEPDYEPEPEEWDPTQHPD